MLLYMFNLSLSISLSILLLILAKTLSNRTNMDKEKMSPFECGFDPKNSARIPFSLRFFLLAVIFLIFDIEIALLMPAPFAMMKTFSMYSIILITIFFLILLIGLMHEWNEGSLDWSM